MASGIPDEKVVLILQSYQRDYTHTRELERGIIDYFHSLKEVNVNYRYEFLDTKNFYSEEYFDDFYKILLEKYEHAEIDGIILCDDDALVFYDLYGRKIWSETSYVVATGINSFLPYPGGVQGVVLIEERPNIEKTIEMAMLQNPQVERLHFIYDVTLTSQMMYDEIIKIQSDYPNADLQWLHYLNETPCEIKALIEKGSNEDVFIHVLYSRDRYGVSYHYLDVLSYMLENSKTPVYVLWEFYMGSGSIGGHLASSYLYGYGASEVLLSLWQGNKLPPLIHERGQHQRYVIDYNAVQQYGIEFIPEKAYLLNEPISYFKEHRTMILYFTGIIFSLILLLILLYYSYVQKKSVLRQKEKLYLQEERFRKELEFKVEERTQELYAMNQELIATVHTLEETMTILKETQEELVESQKIASLAEMARVIAHQLNTPLGIMTTAMSHYHEQVNTMIKGHEIDGDRKVQLDVIKRLFDENLKASIELVHTFKMSAESSKVSNQKLFNFSQLILEFVNRKKSIDNSLAFELDVQENLYIRADPTLLLKLMEIFYDNTLRFGFRQLERGLIKISLSKEKEGLIFRFCDNGEGFSSDVKNRLFEPFYTSNMTSFGGVGLGLFFVYNIVTQHLKGKIQASSIPYEKTCFSIELPYVNEKSETDVKKT